MLSFIHIASYVYVSIRLTISPLQMAVEAYLQHAISLPLLDVTDLCAFLSSNVIDKSSYNKVKHWISIACH